MGSYLIESQVICIILLTILGVYNFKFDHGMKRSLKGIYIFAILAAVADILRWSMAMNGFMVAPHVMGVFYYIFREAIGYLWLCLSAEKLDEKLYQNKLFKILSALPVVLVAVISGVRCISHAGSGFFADGSCCESGFPIGWVSYIYVAAVCVLSVKAIKKANGNRQKQEIILLPILTFIPVLADMLERWLPINLSLLSYSVLISILILFIYTGHQKLRVDNLTRLMNRYGMDDEISAQLEQYRKDKNDLFYVIVCDMDNFKHINDTWGHQEGDRALRLISDVLIRVSERYDAAAFRIGGDEFVIFVDVSEDTIPKEICSALKTELDDIDFRDDFDIRMSMGIAKYDGRISVAELLNSADMELYEAKRKGKGGGK